jgi:hypothetical protein
METPHALGQDEALRRLREKFDSLRAKHGGDVHNLSETWNDHTLDFSFTAMGMNVGGTVKVEDRAVKLDAEIPFAAMLFKKAIEGRIREELGGLLA